MARCVLSVLLLSLCRCSVSGLYLHLSEGHRRCFTEDVPEDSLLTGDCRIELLDEQMVRSPPPPLDHWVLVEATDPDDQLVLSQLIGSEGTFKLTSRQSGRHQICLHTGSSGRPPRAGPLLAVHLDIRRGRAYNQPEFQNQDRETELQQKVLQLKVLVQEIQMEQEYQRIRHQRFREVQHNTDMWIFWLPVVRSLYVVAFVMWFSGTW